jgi:hypothetical protein
VLQEFVQEYRFKQRQEARSQTRRGDQRIFGGISQGYPIGVRIPDVAWIASVEGPTYSCAGVDLWGLGKMDEKTSLDCLQEAARLSRKAIMASDQTEELRLLRLSAAWVEVAKHRAEQEGAMSVRRDRRTA